jgi:hypothetical protein
VGTKNISTKQFKLKEKTMYTLIVKNKPTLLDYTLENVTPLDMDNYLTLEGFELVQEAARAVMVQPQEPYDPTVGDDDLIPEQVDCRVVQQYISNALSLIIGCVREFGAVQINLTTMSISNTIDPSIESSITFIQV